MITEKKHRKKRSKYDAHYSLISELVNSGMSVRKIVEHLEPIMYEEVYVESLYSYITKRGLKSKVTQGGTNNNYIIPVCSNCEYGMKVTNTNNSKSYVCTELMQIINGSCKTSPMECPRRGRMAAQ